LWKTGFTLTSKRSSEMVLELPELVRENQNWKIYRTHILDSTAVEGVVSHLAGAAPKPVDSCELEAWNWSNSVAKYIIQDVISDSLLVRLMHHELAHSLFSHLAAIFGDHKPIALKPPAEWSDENEPLCEDSHPKSDSTYSACTAAIVEGKHVERASAAPRIAHDTDRDNDYTISLTFKLKTTNIHDKKPSGTTPAGIAVGSALLLLLPLGLLLLLGELGVSWLALHSAKLVGLGALTTGARRGTFLLE